MAAILKDYLSYPARVVLISACITSCSVIQPLPDNKPVRLVFYNEINLAIGTIPECVYKGPIVGSEGHWYSYLFIANEESGTYSHHLFTGLDFELTSLLDLEVGFVWDRVQDPQPDSAGVVPEKDDYRLSFGLGIDF